MSEWELGSVEGKRGRGERDEEVEGRTGPLGSKVLGSAAWSDWSLMERESRVERKDFANESSVILAVWRYFRFEDVESGWSSGTYLCVRS